jgi:hypothetical protein
MIDIQEACFNLKLSPIQGYAAEALLSIGIIRDTVALMTRIAPKS